MNTKLLTIFKTEINLKRVKKCTLKYSEKGKKVIYHQTEMNWYYDNMICREKTTKSNMYTKQKDEQFHEK